MPVNIVIPTVGESVSSGVIAAWRVPDGAWVDRDQTVLDLETDKVTMEVPAPSAGVVRHSAKQGQEVAVGAVVGSIDETAAKPAAQAVASAAAAKPASVLPAPGNPPSITTSTPQAGPSSAANGSGHAPAEAAITPAARKLADELGVDISRLDGTGPGHRIREIDVLAAHHARAAESSPTSPASVGQATQRASTREPMTKLRQRVAERLVEAQRTAAMLTTFNEVDMSAVMDLRKQHKEAFEKRHGVGLGFMGFFVRATCAALRAYPIVNASIVRGSGGSPQIEKHDFADVAIAVASPKGLVVPVIRDAHRLSLAQIELAIKELAVKAKEGKLTIEELTGGTFTITNGGIFGSLMSTPILNPPQSAILGMHTIKGRPVEHPAGSGNVAVRPMMYLALSYDHRIIDGAEAVQFLVHIKNAIEDPARLLLEI